MNNYLAIEVVYYFDTNQGSRLNTRDLMLLVLYNVDLLLEVVLFYLISLVLLHRIFHGEVRLKEINE